MNRDEIMNMQPGRELDELVLEKVFGRTVTDDFRTVGEFAVASEFAIWEFDNKFPNQQPPETCPRFSTNIAAAWDVVEKLQERNRRICLANYLDGAWAVSVRDGGGGYIVGENVFLTAPKAICMAALLCIIQEDTPNQ